MALPEIIIEPDSAGAWIGAISALSGVVLGGVLEWVRSSLVGRRARRAEIDAAAQELRAAVNALAVTVSGMKMANPAPTQVIDWFKLEQSAIGRTQDAAWVVSRRSPALADAALALDQKAVQFLQAGGTDTATMEVQAALVAFTALARKQRL